MIKLSQIFDFLMPRLSLGGGGGGPQSVTQTTSTIPEEFHPQLQGLLNAAGESLFQGYRQPPGEDGKPGPFVITGPQQFSPWNPQGTYVNARGETVTAPGATVDEGSQYVAGMTPGQQQAMGIANWLGTDYVRDPNTGQIMNDPVTGKPIAGGQTFINEQYGRAADFASRGGWGAQDIADQAGMYGGLGYKSGARGEGLGVQGGEYYGGMGAGYGQLGQQIGAEGGGYYGGLGAQYGGMGADLAPEAQQYGRLGTDYGALGQELAARYGAQYGGMGAGYGSEAAGLAPAAQQFGNLGVQYGDIAQQLGAQRGEYFGDLGAGYGAGAAGLTPEAQRYGQRAADIGSMGLRAEELGRDITGEARGYAGQAAGIGGLYERMATSAQDVGRFMSPYTQGVIAQQQEGAVRQKQIADQARKAAAARAGAFGGARQAIEQSEADRALQSQLQGIEATGLQNAYQQAQANILNRAQLESQGLAGAQAGLGTALQGGQLGLSGIGQAMAGQQAGLQGLGQAGQLYGLGMQGAGMGLQGLQQQLAGTAQGMQGAGMGLQGVQQQLAGTAQGMQGAQTGLQGAQLGLGAYGQMGQAGMNLADITAGRLRDVMGIGQYQFGMGEQQRQLDQQAINQAILNFQMSQELPFQRLSQYNALLRGYVMPGQTTTQYQAAAPLSSQLAGLGTAGIGLGQLANVGKKAGGTVRGGDGVDTLALNRALRGG